MSVSTILIVAGFAFAIFFIVAMGMAIGVMFGRRPISGSCGGLGQKKDAEGKTSCSLCENPDEACRELRNRQRPTGVEAEHLSEAPGATETARR